MPEGWHGYSEDHPSPGYARYNHQTNKPRLVNSDATWTLCFDVRVIKSQHLIFLDLANWSP
jgi:hypothetical protein